MKVFIVFAIIAISLFFITKARVKDKLNTKLELVKTEWDTLANMQNQNQLYICKLIQFFPELEDYNDSIGFLFDQCQTKFDFIHCNDTIIANQYRLNESFLILKRQISDTNWVSRVKTDSILSVIEESMWNMNKCVKKYNSVVKEFNLYYSTFPVFLIAKSAGLRRQTYFELTYGAPNVDPIAKKNEIPEWQKRIEEEHGFVD
jgi:hypothetical protein